MTAGTEGRHASPVDGVRWTAGPSLAPDGTARLADPVPNGRAAVGPVAGPGAAAAGRRPRPTRRQVVVLAAVLGLLVVLGALAGLVVSALRPSTYAARADVLYALTREQPTGFLREDRNISTQLVLLDSRSVLGPVAAGEDVRVEDLAVAVDAAVVGESEVISVTLTDRDPERAQRLLSAIVTQYLLVSGNDRRADLRGYLEGELQAVLDRQTGVRAGTDGDPGELAALTGREQWLRTQLDELRLTDLAGPAAEVLVEPYVETDPVAPDALLGTAAGAASGLVVAALVVVVLARRATRPGSRGPP